MPIQTAADSISNSAGSPFGFKNRIINGAMAIDQRYAGTASASSLSGYLVDRWSIAQSTTGKLIAQQNAGSVTPPTGFTNYLGVTSQSAYTAGTNDFYAIIQSIEGYNIADLEWGTANAKTATLSFWVRSSLTGTFGATMNNGGSRSYPITYTISAANTWEYKTITIPGDTSGSWGSTNGVGAQVWFSLGVGSTYGGTSGVWSSTNYVGVASTVSVVGTSGATFYVTGVQFEKGSQATAFDYRDYGREFIMCQRYFQKNPYIFGAAISTTSLGVGYVFPVVMRAAPTGALLTSTPYAEWPDSVGYTASSASFAGSIGAIGGEMRIYGWTGLVAGKAPMWFSQNQMSFSAEL